MENIVNKEPFSAPNPYEDHFLEKFGSLFGRKIVSLEKGDSLVEFANHIAKWGKALLFSDYEKQVDFVGKTAVILDYGVYGTLAGIEVATVANNLFNLQFQKNPYLSSIPGIIRFLSIPLSVFFLVMGFIEGFVELVNIRRVASLLYHVKKYQEAPLQALQIIKDNYFTLNQKEVSKIHGFIEKALPHISNAQKSAHFNHIANKALKIKFASLKRRITPGLAKEVASQLAIIMNNLKSWNPTTVEAAKKRASLLMQSINTQAKNKILIHILGFSAILLGLLSILGSMFGIASLPFVVSIALLITTLVVVKLFLKHGPLAKEIEQFYDRLAEFNLQEAVS